MQIGDEIELLRRRYAPGTKQLSKIRKSRENSLYERSRLSKLSATRKRDQSLFSLLLEVESRLRTDGRNDQIERLKRSKEKDRQRSRVNNLSRYCE